jgi:hypothetical protein
MHEPPGAEAIFGAQSSFYIYDGRMKVARTLRAPLTNSFA